jgi:multisubunit Na+/H+ antiporter MnhG subunit
MKRMTDVAGMVGAIVLLVGVALQTTHWAFAPYIYIVGAVVFSYVQVVHDRYEGSNFIIKRLRRQQIFGAIALMLAGVMMFTMHHNEWIVCLTIAAVLELYTAFRIPSELEKEK